MADFPSANENLLVSESLSHPAPSTVAVKEPVPDVSMNMALL